MVDEIIFFKMVGIPPPTRHNFSDQDPNALRFDQVKVSWVAPEKDIQKSDSMAPTAIECRLFLSWSMKNRFHWPEMMIMIAISVRFLLLATQLAHESLARQLPTCQSLRLLRPWRWNPATTSVGGFVLPTVAHFHVLSWDLNDEKTMPWWYMMIRNHHDDVTYLTYHCILEQDSTWFYFKSFPSPGGVRNVTTGDARSNYGDVSWRTCKP